jgi:hypothetical protein
VLCLTVIVSENYMGLANVQNLEAQLEALQAALLRDEAQSVRLCEENEERLRTITDQNLVSRVLFCFLIIAQLLYQASS